MTDEVLRGRLVLDDGVVPGRLVGRGRLDRAPSSPTRPTPRRPPARSTRPGFIDVHVHGWGGHDATGDADALSGMARALLRRGVTSFLPTAPDPPRATSCRPSPSGSARWMPDAPDDGAQPLGFNLEGPFLAPERRGAHDPALLRDAGGDGRRPRSTPLLDGLRVITVAPELPGALELIARLAARGVAASLGHSAVDARRRRGPATRRAPARRPTCSTR